MATEKEKQQIALELLKEVIPKLSRVAFIGNSNATANAQVLRETELAAPPLGYRMPRKLYPHFKPSAKAVLKPSSYK